LHNITREKDKSKLEFLAVMDKRNYHAAQYTFIMLFVAFFIYIVSWRCQASLSDTILCWPKVLGLSIWFVASMFVLKIINVRLRRSTDAKEAALFWLINVIIFCLYLAAFAYLFVLNYI
jgi:hypothetical protein